MDFIEQKLNWWDKLTGPFYRLGWRICEKWKEFGYRKQRFKRGYASCDVWELRTWFVNTLRPMLEDLLVHHTGHPAELTNDEWESILTEMIQLLDVMDIWDDSAASRQIGALAEDRTYETETKISEEKLKATEAFFSLFSKWFWDLWD